MENTHELWFPLRFPGFSWLPSWGYPEHQNSNGCVAWTHWWYHPLFHQRYTKQHAFKDVEALIQAACDHSHVPLNHASGAIQIWMVTNGCAMGMAGLVSQGNTWKNTRIAAFYSAKLNCVQQNNCLNFIYNHELQFDSTFFAPPLWLY